MRAPVRSRPLALLALVAAVAAAEERPGEPSRRTIAVTGQGETKGVPDRLLVSFAVESTAARATEAAAANARTTTAVASAVQRLLAAGETVTTTRYTIEPRYETPHPGESREPRITGYLARNEVQVETQSVDKADALIDTAIAAGANRIGGLQFMLSNRAQLLRVAVERAGADARAQAESAAKGLGVRLKQVVSATTGTTPVVLPRRYEALAAAEGRAPATPIEPGEATVSATLQVTFEIE